MRRISRRQLIGGGTALGTLSLATCTPSVKKNDAQVIILGAGLAGLHAARLLEADGRDVMVLEGSARVGGRLLTVHHDQGHYTEAGGEEIGASYARILNTISTLGLATTPDSPVRQGTSYVYKGITYNPKEWKSLETHPFSAPFQGASPSAPLFRLAAAENPLKAASDWRDPAFQNYDISAEAFLNGKGLSKEARAVIDHTLNGNRLESYSMMNLFRSLQIYSQSLDMGPSVSINGGAQRLPESMAASLARPVKLNHRVVDIEATDSAVMVTDAKGQVFRAPHVICTLPYGALRRIKVKAPLSSSHEAAITALPYTQILQLHFKVDTPFWETDGLPANMWMDGPLERVFMKTDSDGKPTRYGRAWINGDRASALSNVDNKKLEQYLKAEISSARPIKPSGITLLKTQRWTHNNPLAGGAYMHWAPQQIGRWANTMGAPSGRLSFAGEHLSYLHTGMEGAMESGENAAFALLGF